ncbi:unnamed protein product [Boreogadus saida]
MEHSTSSISNVGPYMRPAGQHKGYSGAGEESVYIPLPRRMMPSSPVNTGFFPGAPGLLPTPKKDIDVRGTLLLGDLDPGGTRQ